MEKRSSVEPSFSKIGASNRTRLKTFSWTTCKTVLMNCAGHSMPCGLAWPFRKNLAEVKVNISARNSVSRFIRLRLMHNSSWAPTRHRVYNRKSSYRLVCYPVQSDRCSDDSRRRFWSRDDWENERSASKSAVLSLLLSLHKQRKWAVVRPVPTVPTGRQAHESRRQKFSVNLCALYVSVVILPQRHADHRLGIPGCRRQPRALKLQRWRKALAAGDRWGAHGERTSFLSNHWQWNTNPCLSLPSSFQKNKKRYCIWKLQKKYWS